MSSPTRTRPNANPPHWPDWVADALDGRPAMLTQPEAASVLRVSPKTVSRRISAGELRAVKDGTCVRIPRRAIGDYLASRGAA